MPAPTDPLAGDLSAPPYEALHASLRRLLARAGGGKLGDRLAAYALAGADLVVYARRVLADERVPRDLRGEVLAGLLYVALPFDVVPESLFGPAGLVDDALVLTRVLDALLNRVEEPIARELWPGDRAVLEAARGIAADGRRLFGAGFRPGARLLARRLSNRIAQAARRRLSEIARAAEHLLAARPEAPETPGAQGLADVRSGSYTTP